MSILGGKSETLTFSRTQNTFGLYWGSIDSYNSIAFYSGNSATPFLTLLETTSTQCLRLDLTATSQAP